MPQQFVTDQGVLIVPGSYASYQVRQTASGLSTSGVLMLVGEAEGGPDWSLETDLSLNSFGPTQAADVASKYKSGNLVDAFRAAVAPMNDPQIQGAPSRVFLIKTNVSAKASLALTHYDASSYGSIYDKGYGTLGNLIYSALTANVTEVVPTTGAFTWAYNISGLNASLRVNGGASQALTLGALVTPAALVIAVNLLAGVTASGGANRLVINAIAGNLSVTGASGYDCVFNISSSWNVAPTAGDTIFVSGTSVIKGGASKNIGSYVVNSSTTTTISATKLTDGTGASGARTAPENVAPTPVASTSADLIGWAPVTIAVSAADPSDGLGKTLEINELSTGTDLLSDYTYLLGTATKATWVSKTGAAVQLTSAAEYQPKLSNSRQFDSVSEDIIVGGEVVLTLGYTGSTATGSAVVGGVVNGSPTTIALTVTNGSGTSIGTLNLAQYPTLNDLATYINSKTGYVAAVASATFGQLPSNALDAGTFTFGSTFGNKSGRIKADAYKFFKKLSENSALVQLGNPARRQSTGLPKPLTTVQYLAGGTKGTTTNTSVGNAFDACKRLRGNFLVPLFSADASVDSANGLTESGSTYTIDSINAAAKSHVLSMSTLKQRRNRQAFLSKSASYAADKLAAANLASFRCSMAYQDVKEIRLGADGGTDIFQFQPWMGAVKAAGGQAAGFYRPLVHRVPNISGFLMGTGVNDFDDQSQDQLEDALIAGLLPLSKDEQGVPFWVSDQTTYTKDSNFVYNSIQAVYVADIVALTAAKRMEETFVGLSIADVSAAIASSTMQGIFADFIRLKLLSPSDDAPRGFKNLTIKISGPVMQVSAEIKIAGAIYFVPISFVVSEVQQSANG